MNGKELIAGGQASTPVRIGIRSGRGAGRWSSWLRDLLGFSLRKSTSVAVPLRHLRPVAVPGSLDDLKGPGSGVVELPITLFWSRPDRKFNLDDRCQAIDMYLAVLDRGNTAEMASYLNGELLVELWPALHLTRAKRLSWQARFAELRPATVAV